MKNDLIQLQQTMILLQKVKKFLELKDHLIPMIVVIYTKKVKIENIFSISSKNISLKS